MGYDSQRSHNRFDAGSRGLHLPFTDAEQVLPGGSRFQCDMKRLDFVNEHPTVELRVVTMPIAPHLATAGPKGCEVRACETKLETSSRAGCTREHRCAADRRQPRCTTSCAFHLQTDPHSLRSDKKNRPATS